MKKLDEEGQYPFLGASAHGAVRPGRSLAAQRFPVKDNILVAMLVVCLLGLGAAACFIPLSRTVTVAGEVVPVEGFMRVVSPRDAIVVAMRANPGEFVRRGTILSVLASNDRASGVDQGEFSLSRTREKLRLVNDSLAAISADTAAQIALLNSQLDGERNELALMQQRRGVQEEQEKASVELAQRFASYASKGYVSGLQIRQQQAEARSTQIQSKTLDGEIAAKVASIALLKLKLERVHPTQDEAKRTLAKQAVDLEIEIADAETKRNTDIVATRDGYVASVSATSGQTLQKGDDLLTVVPANGGVRLRLLIPNAAGGLIRSGMPGRVRFDAYPYQQFGFWHAVIDHVDGAPHRSNDSQSTAGRDPDQGFVAFATLQSPVVRVLGERRALLPGLQARVDVTLQRKSAAAWAVDMILGRDRASSQAR